MQTKNNDFVHKFMGKFRTELIPPKTKHLVRKEGVEEKFDRAKSIFRDWRETSNSDLERIY